MIRNVYNKVVRILMDVPPTRDNDDLLIAEFDRIYGMAPAGVSHYDIQSKRGIYGLPPTESIGRARRRAQADMPELRGSRKVRIRRAQKEEEYRKWAVEKP